MGQGCVAFVETWQEGGKYNRSHIFAKMLIRMGAKIEHDFNKDKKLTHLIFKDGRKVFLKKPNKEALKWSLVIGLRNAELLRLGFKKSRIFLILMVTNRPSFVNLVRLKRS